MAVIVSLRDVPAPGDEAIASVAVRRSGAEQSNSSVIFGARAILKVYRRLEPGSHPELELGRYLRTAGFDDVPAVLGSMEYRHGDACYALAVLHELVPDAIDGWEHAKTETADYYARVTGRPASDAERLCPSGRLLDVARAPLPAPVLRVVGDYLAAARTLGEQTAALHRTLARGAGAALEPEPLRPEDVTRVVDGTRARTRRAFADLAALVPTLQPHAANRAGVLLSREAQVFARLDRASGRDLAITRTRCHQDYHLGQVLWTGSRYVLLDFEGEPARTDGGTAGEALAHHRRRRHAPLLQLCCVVGTLRLGRRATGTEQDADETWARLWEAAVGSTFLSAYLAATRDESFVPSDDDTLDELLGLLMLDKAVYELQYEINNRPDWLLVPVEGLIRILQ